MPVLVVMKCDKLGRSHVFVCIAAPNSFGKTKLIYELVGFLPKVKNDLCYRDFNTGLSPLTNVVLANLQGLTAFMQCHSCLVFWRVSTGTKLSHSTVSGRESVLSPFFKVIVNGAFSSSVQTGLPHRHKTEAEYWIPQANTERIY